MSKLFLILCLLSSFNISAQKKKGKAGHTTLTARDWEQFAIDRQCDFRLKYTKAQRSKLKPFDSASQVLLISFSLKDEEDEVTKPFRGDTIVSSRIKEIASLTDRGIDSLTNILYNYGFRRTPRIDLITSPNFKNAIVFQDSTGKVIDYLFVCFDCNLIHAKSKELNKIELCTGKLELLMKFFKSHGVRFGVHEEGENEPGE